MAIPSRLRATRKLSARHIAELRVFAARCVSLEAAARAIGASLETARTVMSGGVVRYATADRLEKAIDKIVGVAA